MTSAAGPLRSTSDAPALLQARLQRAQRLRQPPARRAAERPNARRSVVEHVRRHATGACDLGGCVQGGMVGKAEVVTVPDDGGGGRHARIGSIEFPESFCLGLRPLMRS